MTCFQVSKVQVEAYAVQLSFLTCSTVNVKLSSAAGCFLDQSGDSFREPLSQAEWIKVSDRKPNMLDVTTLFAAVYDWLDI